MTRDDCATSPVSARCLNGQEHLLRPVEVRGVRGHREWLKLRGCTRCGFTSLEGAGAELILALLSLQDGSRA